MTKSILNGLTTDHRIADPLPFLRHTKFLDWAVEFGRVDPAAWTHPSSSNTLLHLSIRGADRYRDDRLLNLALTYVRRNGLDANQRNVQGVTALHLAVECKNLEIVRRLVSELDAFVDLSTVTKYTLETAVDTARRIGCTEIVGFLEEKMAKERD